GLTSVNSGVVDLPKTRIERGTLRFDAFDKTIVLVKPEDSDGGKQSAPLGAALGVNDRLALVGPLADPITASGILHSQVSSKQLGLQPIRFLAQCCGNRIVQSG